jgi:uncharacterized protein
MASCERRGSFKGFMLTTHIELPMDKIAEFCRRWGVARLETFASAIRDEFRPGGDVDYMFTPGPGFHRETALGPMTKELAGLLGREVNLTERCQIERMDNRIQRRHILQTASSVYVD